MEEDVEIEELLKRNEGLLIDAANSTDPSLCSEGEESDRTDPSDSIATNPDEFPPSFTKNEKQIEIDEVQELLDDNLISYRTKRVEPPSRAASESSDSDVEIISNAGSDFNDGDAFINEIMSDNEGQYKEQLRKHIGNKTKQLAGAQILEELCDVRRVIFQRGSFLDNLEVKLNKELSENAEKQNEVRLKLIALSERPETGRHAEPSYSRCFFKKFGMPYFKDSNGFKPPVPYNRDHKKKIEHGELIVSTIPKIHVWVKTDKDMLCKAVRDTLIEERSCKLKNEIKKLKCSSTFKSAKELDNQITSCQRKLRAVKSKSYLDLVGEESPDREYDWLKYSATIFQGKHSPEECKRFWHIYLKPTINRKSWGVSEDLKLLEIAEEMHHQDWDAIAKLLGTNRSAYQCLVHFNTRINTKRDSVHGKWTEEEDEKLRCIIDASKIAEFIPWSKVASHFPNRTHHQIYNRWVNCLNPKIIKGRFSPQEDLLIVSGIEVFGVTFKELASLLNNRTSSQIRERYERHLLPKTAKTGTWSLNEDENLVSLVEKYGEGKWVTISKELKTRSRTQCRQRYGFIKNMRKKNPDWDIGKINRKQLNNVSKVIGRTSKYVDKIKQEIEKVESTFRLSQIETETFRIEKLKEMRDLIISKKCDLRRKKKVFADNSEVNSLLLEYFKTSYTKLLTRSVKFCDDKERESYMNEMILLAKYFGHRLQLPESEYEIENNPNLSDNLKYILKKHIRWVEERKLAKRRACESIAACSASGTNIDYEPPEVDDTIIMIDSWHSPPIDVSTLNFSEYFKRIVFDFSYGMHKDIWRSKMRRTLVPQWTTLDNTDFGHSETYQPFYIPPNLQTALGYKTMLLGRNRLKKEANQGFGKKLFGCINEIQTKNELAVIKNEIEVDCMLLDQYQETMLSLFAWSKVMSVTDVGSTRLGLEGNARTGTQHQMNRPKQTAKICDIPSKKRRLENAKEKKDTEVRIKKSRLELKEEIRSQGAENQKGIRYRRKMQIENLAGQNPDEPKVKIARIYRPRWKGVGNIDQLENKVGKTVKNNTNTKCEVDELPMAVREGSKTYKTPVKRPNHSHNTRANMKTKQMMLRIERCDATDLPSDVDLITLSTPKNGEKQNEDC